MGLYTTAKRNDDQPSKASEQTHGRRIASHAESVWGWSSHAGQLRANRRATLLMQMSGISHGQRALEIGCGTGLFTAKLAESGADLAALDISPELLALARGKSQGISNLNLLMADAEHLPFPNRHFDVVVGSSILHHLPVRPCLAEMLRVLRPGGRLAFAEPNMMNPQVMIQKNVPVIKKWLGDVPDETAFFRWSLANVLRRTGFVDVAIDTFDFLHPSTPRLLTPWVRWVGARLERTPVLREFAGSLIITAKRGAG